MRRIVQLAAASAAMLAALGAGGRALAEEPRDATRGGVNGPAVPDQRGRESPLSIDATRGGVNGPAVPDQRGRESPLSIDATRIEVQVGDSVERDVGFAVGLLCDDVAIVHAELRSETPESNVLRVTGVKPGDTQCRAGTVPGRPVFVFEIHVTARHTPSP